MKLGQRLSLFVLVIFVLLLASCGQTYELVSLELTPTHPNVVGIGGTAQFAVTAKYSNTKSSDVTHRSAYTITAPSGTTSVVPPGALTMSPTGRLEVVLGACTWTNSGTTTDPVYGTDPYVLKAKFDNQEAIAFVSVAAIAGCEYPK